MEESTGGVVECAMCSSTVVTAITTSTAVHALQHLGLESRTASAFLCQPSAQGQASPFSMPLASLVGALQQVLPPAAVSQEDLVLLTQAHAPTVAAGQLIAASKHLSQQDTLSHPLHLAAAAPYAAVETVITVSAQRRVVLEAPADHANADAPSLQRSVTAASPSPSSLGCASEPILVPSSCSKGRLPSCATSLASITAIGSQAATASSSAPPHGVKAVCGKRAKMEDAFSVQCNFADVQIAAADETYANKLPARIASQVGEQLEVAMPLQPLPGGAAAVAASSPPPSVPLSPHSTNTTAAVAAAVLVQSETEVSVGGGSTAACTVASGSTAACTVASGSDGSSASASLASSGAASCSDTLHFFAVYDGHGGVEAAQHCANRLHFHLSAALALIAGATFNTQDDMCMAHRSQNADGSTATASIQCEAEWSLCRSPGPGYPPAAGAEPERSVDSITEPPSLADLHATAAAAEPNAAAADVPQPPEPAPASGVAHHHAQQHVARFLSSSDGADPPAAPPSPLPSSAALQVAQPGAGAAAGLGEDGDTSSSHSGGEAARSESAGVGSGGGSGASACVSEVLEAALRMAFLRTDEEFSEDGSSAMVGSTAVVALVGNKKLWIANCGDSRAVLCRGGRAIQVTDDHKPEREDEAARVEKAGGQVLYWNGHRVMGVLAMSRAIGDHGLRPFVIPEPEITVLLRVSEDDFLLLASDGLWDVMSNQEAITLAMRCLQRSYDKGTSRKAAVRVAATVLTRAAVDRGSKDNVTVLIVDLKPAHEQPGGGAPAAANGAVQGGGGTALVGCSTVDLAAVCGADNTADDDSGGGAARRAASRPLVVPRTVAAEEPADGVHAAHGGAAEETLGLRFQDTIVTAPHAFAEAVSLVRSMMAEGAGAPQ